MDKLKMRSLDGVAKNIELIGRLFPNAITEVKRGEKLEKAIDFDILRQELSDSIVEGREERYQFTWPDKKKAILAANAPINAALRPIVADSVAKDGTPGGFDSENLYIEGDNLEVLKLLRETYLGKVKMIYIDPPYNTGNDFVYEDDFSAKAADYLENSGQFDEYGQRMVTNLNTNGRFHTDWLNMIYPRLKVARDLLADDGVIFISIDDNEQENLKKICDEIFGESNFVAQIVWEKVHTRKNSAINFSSSHEYILSYAKIRRNDSNDVTGFKRNLLPRDNTDAYANPDNDPKGPWKADPITAHNYYAADYTITKPNGTVISRPKDRYWRYSKETIEKMIAENAIIWGNGDSMPLGKRYLCDVQNGLVPVTLFSREFAGDTSLAKRIIDDIFYDCKGIFGYTKPVKLITRLSQIASDKDSLILDFFSGSATTAHAVMQLNAEDGGHRKYIMVQLPELTSENSEAYKAGYKNICEIGKERIRRAGRKIKEEAGLMAQDLDFGFRCLRLDSSNMKDVYYKPEDLGQMELDKLIDNVKEDRSAEDLLFQVMLELSLELSLPIETIDIADYKVFKVDGNYLIACFEPNITEDVVTAIAKEKPTYAVLRDSSLLNDSLATNFEQIFKAYSPATITKVL